MKERKGRESKDWEGKGREGMDWEGKGEYMQGTEVKERESVVS